MADALDTLVGEWRVVATLGDGTRVSDSSAKFEWIAEGDFLVHRWGFEVTDDAPQGWKDGGWETSPDGKTWELDFELTYTRSS